MRSTGSAGTRPAPSPLAATGRRLWCVNLTKLLQPTKRLFRPLVPVLWSDSLAALEASWELAGFHVVFSPKALTQVARVPIKPENHKHVY